MTNAASTPDAPVPLAGARVRWSAKGRALYALPMPLFAAGAWFALPSAAHPSVFVAASCVALSLSAALFQLHTAFYRLEADRRGFEERWLWGSRRRSWDEVRKVELIAQRAKGQAIVPSSSGAKDAFHVLLHTRSGRVSVHRLMNGVDELLSLLAAVHVLERDDPEVPSALPPAPDLSVIDQVGTGLPLSRLLMLMLPFSFLCGLAMAWLLPFRPTSVLLLDAGLLGFVPWGSAYVAYWVVTRERTRRFGSAHARPPLAVVDAALVAIAATAAPPLLWVSLPELFDLDEIHGLMLCVGVLLAWYPFAELRRVLRERLATWPPGALATRRTPPPPSPTARATHHP